MNSILAIQFSLIEEILGQLVVNGSGTDQSLYVYILWFRTSQLLVEKSSSGGGDYQQAIYVLNNDNMVFENLEVQNNRQAPRTNVDNSDSFGVHIHNTIEETLNNFVFKNMTFKNVYAIAQVDPSDQQAFNQFEVAGIRIFTDWNKAPINNVFG